ncbi:hypothetical protein NTGBS_950001 [Candidatus Nitrotoga sp. BS]|nr:hypothetical protein [Candidatus Nitrotoga sp. BS]CAH1212499.1 hypothetical protein NTGBS_950001 [Candidatus Nitrotoga sp. BS]
MWRYSIENIYDELKKLARGKGSISRDSLHAFTR